jgi:hypothetical protein
MGMVYLSSLPLRVEQRLSVSEDILQRRIFRYMRNDETEAEYYILCNKSFRVRTDVITFFISARLARF